MSNTITKLSTDPMKAVYKHEETGFTIHEVWSITDVIEANGAIAMDMASGSWAWVAGEDLFLEVYKKGGNTLQTLARNMLNQVWQLCWSRISYGHMWLGTAANADEYGWTRMTGKLPTARTTGNDLRLFAVYTNLQAGRGMSTDLLNDSIMGTDNGSTGTYGTYGYIMGDMPNHIGRNEYSLANTTDNMPSSFASNNKSYGKSATVIGRAIVAVPLRSWDDFLTRWRSALPNIDKPEVQERADEAISRFIAVFKDVVFSVPSLRVPLVLTNDGKAYIDGNPTRSIVKQSADTFAGVGRWHAYNPIVSPTIVDETGYWVTNPHCAAPGVTHSMLPHLHEGMNYSSMSPGPVPNMTTASSFVLPMSEVNTLGGVDLFKIAGGFYPRVAATKINKTDAELVSLAMRGVHDDQPLPAQTGGETNEQFASRMAAFEGGSGYSSLNANYGHWHLSGQVVLLVSTMLDAAVQRKTLRGKDLFTCASGNLCRLMRVQNHAHIYGALMADVSSDPALYLGHQYAA